MRKHMYTRNLCVGENRSFLGVFLCFLIYCRAALTIGVIVVLAVAVTMSVYFWKRRKKRKGIPIILYAFNMSYKLSW